MQFSTKHNPDVLNCLANLSNDEVFMPPSVANLMLDLLPKNIWEDETVTFLDPVSKSGVFLREIAKRLIEGLKIKFPVLEERLNHIYKNQIFGIAITELTALLSRRTVYCSKNANGKYAVPANFESSVGNIIFNQISHQWKNSNCIFCGASKTVYNRGVEQNTFAYEFIHTSNPESLFSMKFDVIVGNPPYQLNDGGGSGSSAIPIYQHFIEQAKKLNPRYLTMIIPSRWFSGGKGLDTFRSTMLKDRRIKTLFDFTDARDCFPGVDIAGGVCYFLWEKSYRGKCIVINSNKGRESKTKRYLDEFDTFIRDGMTLGIVKKVQKLSSGSIEEFVSPRNPFGLASKMQGSSNGDLNLVSSKGVGKFYANNIPKGHHMINFWKVFVSKASFDHGGQPDKEGRRRILSKVFPSSPKTVCTESYLTIGPLNNKEEAKNLTNYLKTRFARFLISSVLHTQNITRVKFKFVPVLDWKESWADEKLHEMFRLSKAEIEYIDLSIKPMEFLDE